MYRFGSRLPRNYRHALTWLLAYVLFVQGLFPLQAHTRWVADDGGLLILVCSWDGTREHLLDTDVKDPAPSDEHRAPACVFSQLLAAVLLPAAVALPRRLFSLAARHIDGGAERVVQRRLGRQRIRAPPID